jgi:phenylalanyl-tRNA synthetase beta chain
VALPGTLLPNGTITEVGVIRGQRSAAMLCSAADLALGTDAGGVMRLKAAATVGTPLNTALSLSDPVLEIDLTPNRADCLSILGVAREAAAIQKTRLRYPAVGIPDADERIHRIAAVAIEAPGHCPRYAARALENVAVKPSPFWLQDRLLSVGLRPINNIVDVTNSSCWSAASRCTFDLAPGRKPDRRARLLRGSLCHPGREGSRPVPIC